MNQGRCGECGDNWATARPRPNDEGGLYGKGIIAANYTQGQVIDVQVILKANHGGFLEFRLCADKTSINELSTDECFDKNLLQLEDGTTRYIVGLAGPATTVNLKVRLPFGVSCQHCVLQMWWKTNSNNNGCGEIGCGNQEQYFNIPANFNNNSISAMLRQNVLGYNNYQYDYNCSTGIYSIPFRLSI